jgi:glycerol-3-phosphate O-acyltransferase
VLGQHLLAERVFLDLADDGHAGAFKAEFQAADAGEQRQDVHLAPSSISSGQHPGHRLSANRAWVLIPVAVRFAAVVAGSPQRVRPLVAGRWAGSWRVDSQTGVVGFTVMSAPAR